MLTRNFRALIAYQLFDKIDYGGLGCVTQTGEIFKTSHTGYYPYTISQLIGNFFNGALGTSYPVGGNYFGVVFGTGTTPATVDDYAMAGEMVTGFSASNVTITTEMTCSDEYAEYTAVYTLTNTTGADVTIGEVGLIDSFRGALEEGSTAYKCYPVIIAREAFASPLTIPAGGVGQITFTIRMNYPTA